jgi:hypothetical protein
MPVLDWIGKAAVVTHHREVPYRLLEPVPELFCGETDSDNLIVQGDNSACAEGVVAALCRAGEMHLYRPAVQHRQ